MNTIEPYKQAHESSLEQFVSHCRISYRSIHNNPRYVNAVVALADQLDDCRDARSRRDVEAANLEQRRQNRNSLLGLIAAEEGMRRLERREGKR